MLVLSLHHDNKNSDPEDSMDGRFPLLINLEYNTVETGSACQSKNTEAWLAQFNSRTTVKQVPMMQRSTKTETL